MVSSVLAAAQTPLKVVPQLDLERFQGTWYEIARLPNRFQDQCVGAVTANYRLRSDGRIDVTNQCKTMTGETDSASGIAKRVDGQPPSVLKVRFAPAFLSFLPMVWGDYQVINLASDYQHALVGTPNRQYLWVLARRPQVDDDTYQSILDRAKAEGFDTTALVKTPRE